MYQFLISVFGFLLSISILVAVHEWGHFFVARRFGIKVLRFSIGFGRPFFRWYDKLGTEYVLSVLPLGGYVALFGERDRDIPESQKHLAFCHKPVGVRILVLAAGPVINLVFAILLYWFVFMLGITSVAPIIGNITPGSIADLAHLKSHQEIVSVENRPTHSWEAVGMGIISALGSERILSIQTKQFPEQFSDGKAGKDNKDGGKDANKDERTDVSKDGGKNGKLTNHTLDISSLDMNSKDVDILKEMGITRLDPYPPVIADVVPDYPAAKAGLQSGDTIVAVNGHKVTSRGEVTDRVQPSINEALTLEVERDHSTHIFHLQPVTKQLEDGKMVAFIGIEYNPNVNIPKTLQRVEKFGPWMALKQATNRTVEYTLLTLGILKKMIVGSVSVKHLSGPVAIAQYAGHSVSIGLEYYLGFLAVISISLGVLNLLPIPLLDGGHLMYCFYELLTGRRPSEHAEAIGIWIGGLILMFVFLVALYNDLGRLFSI